MDPSAKSVLGKSGVPITKLGFGAAGLGDIFSLVDEATAAATLEAAWDEGMRYFDTAPHYGNGLSEIRTGRVLDTKPRADVVVSTKVGRWFEAPTNPDAYKPPRRAGGLRFSPVYDYSYDGIMRAYEQSQLRTGLNRLDLLIIHDLGSRHHNEAQLSAYFDQLVTSGWRALEILRAHGVIRGIGVGINERGFVPRFLDLFDPDFFLVAMEYTLLLHEEMLQEIDLCQSRNVGVIIGSVFASGILASGATPNALFNYRQPSPEIVERVRRIEQVCASHGVPLPAAALQFPMGHPAVSSVIPGATDPRQVAMNAANFRYSIPVSLWSDLKSEKLISGHVPTPTI